MLPEEHKARMRDTQFPQDLQKAFELGKRVAPNTIVGGNPAKFIKEIPEKQ